METQEQDKKKKLPLWVRLVIYITLFLLIGLAITWILNQRKLLPEPWSNIFAPIFSLLGAIFDKDIRKLIFERFLPKPPDDPKSSTDTSSSAQPSVSINFNPSITVSPSINASPNQNAYLRLASAETNIPQNNANATQSDDPPIIQQDREAGTSYEQKETHAQIPNQAEPHPISTTLPANPDSIFPFNTLLPHPNEFFGRVLDRNILINRTFNGSSTSIVGSRRIGKSWLIEYLRLVAKDQLGSRFRIGYIDATAPICATVAGFTARALEELGILSSYVENTNLELTTLEKIVKDLKLRNQIPVLCVDEFEGFSNRQIFNLSFFTGLRAMTQVGLVLVVASKRPLIDFVGRDGETSGFFNVFEQLTLKPFNVEVAREFAQVKGAQAGFTEQEREILLKYGQAGQPNGEHGGPPIRLQLVGKMLLWDKLLYHNRSGYLDAPDYCQDFEERLEEKYWGVVQ